MKYIKYTFIVLAGMWALLFIISDVLKIQDRLVFHPATPIGAFLDRYPEPLRKYTQKTARGNEIALWVTGGNPQKPVIILSHGRSAHERTLIPLIKILREDDNIVILYSYSGYPPSAGRPSEKNTYDDLASVVNFAKTNFNAGRENIILAGHSLGAAVAIDAAARNNYKAVIAMVPFSSIRDFQTYRSRRKGFLRILRLLPVKHKFDSASKVGKITSPFYLFYSKEDDVTPYFMPQKLLARNPNIISFSYERGDHNDVSWFARDLAEVIKKINQDKL